MLKMMIDPEKSMKTKGRATKCPKYIRTKVPGWTDFCKKNGCGDGISALESQTVRDPRFGFGPQREAWVSPFLTVAPFKHDTSPTIDERFGAMGPRLAQTSRCEVCGFMEQSEISQTSKNSEVCASQPEGLF